MGEKKNALFTTAVIAAIILIFTIADLCRDDRIYSETENRLLASRPTISRENIFSGYLDSKLSASSYSAWSADRTHSAISSKQPPELKEPWKTETL